MENMFKFDIPKNKSSIIKVFGVGGGGSNAVNHMFKQGIVDVDFILCNTDAQALQMSPIPMKIQLGETGLGAGNDPLVGKNSALESLDDIKDLLQQNTEMLFITAGMGGGTGTGAAPIIASVARELGVLTVGIVTMPFLFEGRKRKEQAEDGIEELKKYCDTMLVICNEKLRELYGNLTLTSAFAKADDVLTTAAKGIAELITVAGHVNVDLKDVRAVMKDGGKALMGLGVAEGEHRALEAIQAALSSPLLDDCNIRGAAKMLLYIASGSEEITMDELSEITDYIKNETGTDTNLIWGSGIDENLDKKISITLIATGFDSKNKNEQLPIREKIVHTMGSVQENKNTERQSIEPMEPKEEQIHLVNRHLEEEETKPQPSEFYISEKSPVINFDITPSQMEIKKVSTQINEPVLIQNKAIETEKSTSFEPVFKPAEDRNTEKLETAKGENDAIAMERIKRLRELSTKLKNPVVLSNLESVPAYVRRNVSLTDTPASSDSQISKFTLDSDSPKFSEENPFTKGNKPD